MIVEVNVLSGSAAKVTQKAIAKTKTVQKSVLLCANVSKDSHVILTVCAFQKMIVWLLWQIQQHQ